MTTHYEARYMPAHALAAPIPRAIALTALAALGLSKNPRSTDSSTPATLRHGVLFTVHKIAEAPHQGAVHARSVVSTADLLIAARLGADHSLRRLSRADDHAGLSAIVLAGQVDRLGAHGTGILSLG
jgi:hypothetical protein